MAKAKIKLPLLVDYLERRLGSARVAGHGEHEFYCPACLDRTGGESDDRKFWVNLDQGRGFCYRCEFKFRTWEYLFRYLNGGVLRAEEFALLQREAKLPQEELAPEVHEILRTAEEAPAAEELKIREVPKEARVLSGNEDARWAQRPLKYLHDRGVPMRLIDRFNIGFCFQGALQNHLIFPVLQLGQPVYYTTRTIVSWGAKSRNPENAPGYHSRQTCLLNYDNVIGAPRIEISEGPFDVLAQPNGVGLMGKFMSSTQARLIAALVPHGLEEVVVVLDDDALKAADRVHAKLVGKVPKVTCLYLDHGDPDERKDELPELLKERRHPTTKDRVRARLARQ